MLLLLQISWFYKHFANSLQFGMKKKFDCQYTQTIGPFILLYIDSVKLKMIIKFIE